MVSLLTFLAFAAYAVAALLVWRDRSFRPLLLLIAGSIATFSQPLWTRLFGGAPDMPGNIVRVGTNFTLPFWTILGGGVLLALPALFVMYGLRHRWWVQHYAAAWGFFLLFVLFYLVLDALEGRWRVLLFARPQLPREGLPASLLHAVLLSGISFGLLYTFVSTRHYGLQIALVPMLVSGLATSLLLLGILCSPLWVARLLKQSDRVVLVSAAISIFLVLWAVHLLASGLHEGRRQRLQWR